MLGSKPRLKIARPSDGIRSTENRLHPVASSSSISPAFSTVAPGIFSRPSRNRADASISGLTSRGDLYSGPSSRSSTRSMARLARRITNRAKSRGFSATVVSLPLLTQLGHLRRLARDDAGARRVLAQGCAAAASPAAGRCRDRTAARPPSSGWAGRRAPRTPAPARRTGPRRPRAARRAAPARPAAGRRRRAARAPRPWRRDARAAGVAASRSSSSRSAGDDTDASTSASSVAVKLAHRRRR